MTWEFADLLGRRLILWAVLSVLAGAILLALGDAFWRGVGLQAVVWGVIDGIIGIVGRRGAARGRRLHAGDETAARREARRIRRLLWVNAGLDVAYVIGGLVLAGPIAAGDPFLTGNGWGVVVQGAFLLVFDALHAIWVPGPEPILPPGLDLFDGPEHEPFCLDPEPGPRDGHDRPGPAALLVHGYGATPAELRSLAERLAAAGWTVEVPLLPGFGAEIRQLPDRRLEDWIGAVEAAGHGLRREGHRPLLVVGFSMGGTLALATERSVRPDGLVLIAPFSWPVNRALWLLAPLVRPLLPTGIRPLSRLDLDAPDVRSGIEGFLPGVDLDDPEVRRGIQGLRVPVSAPEQLFRASRAADQGARRVAGPVLAIQGTTDAVSLPTRTERLLERLPRRPELVELDAGHDLLATGSAVREAVEDRVVAFADSLRSAEPG
jgi:alpha-beta hydrolase superfamily lysophospholipase